MCSRISRLSPSTPAWAGPLLVVCLLALSLHFLGENLARAATPDPAPVAASGHSPYPGHDLTEDHFIVASPVALSLEPDYVWDRPVRPVSVYRLLLAPPVPPPNL
jgi:hypothetical protein